MRSTAPTTRKPVKGIKKGDTVKVIAGKAKGTTATVAEVNVKTRTVKLEGLGVITRHLKPNQFNPRGGDKQVHVGFDISKVTKVDAAAKPAAKPAKSKKETK